MLISYVFVFDKNNNLDIYAWKMALLNFVNNIYKVRNYAFSAFKFLLKFVTRLETICIPCQIQMFFDVRLLYWMKHSCINITFPGTSQIGSVNILNLKEDGQDCNFIFFLLRFCWKNLLYMDFLWRFCYSWFKIEINNETMTFHIILLQ